MERIRFLGTFGIIREGVKVGIRNPNFILLATIVSLPLFSITLLHDWLVQMEASRSPRFTDPPPNSDPVTKLTHLMSGTGWALQLGLLHLIPMASLNLLMAVTTVHTASAIHVGARPVGLQDMLHNSIAKTRWKGPGVTYILTSLISNISLTLIVLFVLLSSILESGNVLLLLLSMMGVIVSFGIWLVLTACWDMGVVVSILEDKGCLQSLLISHYLIKGNMLRGFLLMFFDFFWFYSLSLSTFLVIWGFSSSIVFGFVHTGLECTRKVMKWIVFMVYYHDCKRRRREKVDMEDGRADEFLCNDFSSR